jgi:hypothetical protein
MFIKKQRGFIDGWPFIIFMLAVTFGLYMVNQHREQNRVDQVRLSVSVPSATEMQMIDEYKAKPSPVKTLSGMYRGSINGEGKALKVSYYFGTESTLAKGIEDGYVEFKGVAKYTIQGSALVFTAIEGDKGLFTPQGEVFEVQGDKLIFPSTAYPFELTKDPK